MTTAHRDRLRRVMTVAWGLYRDGGRTFSEALAGAWRFLKKLWTQRPAFKSTGTVVRSVALRSMGRSALVGGRRSMAYGVAFVGA